VRQASNRCQRTICKEPELGKAAARLSAALPQLASKLAVLPRKTTSSRSRFRWLWRRHRADAAYNRASSPCLKATLRAAPHDESACVSEGILSSFKSARISALQELQARARITLLLHITIRQFGAPPPNFTCHCRFDNAAKKGRADGHALRRDSGLEPTRMDHTPWLKIFVDANAVKRSAWISMLWLTACSRFVRATILYLVRACARGRSSVPGGVFAGGDNGSNIRGRESWAPTSEAGRVDKPGFYEQLEPPSLANSFASPAATACTPTG